MNCHCGRPARNIISREGKPLYVCPLGRCRLYALAPVQCEGYTRVLVNPTTPADTIIVRFEALLHPEAKELSCTGKILDTSTAVIASVQGDLESHAELKGVLEHSDFSPLWYSSREAYLYPMRCYSAVVSRLRSLPRVLVEEVPQFFFRTFQKIQQLVDSHPEHLTQGSTSAIDPEDIVYTQLKNFQKEGVQYVVSRGGRAMIADEMGLGKTIEAIAVAHHYRDEWPVLVACPMSLTENWLKEFNRFCGLPFSRMVALQGGTAKTQSITSLHDVVVISYASLKAVEKLVFNVVILDESHYIKAGSTKRSQLALRLCRAAKRVVLLSGTPAMSRPMELYAQLQAIHPSIVPTRSQYGARYCNAFVSRFGVDANGHSHTDELHLLLQGFVIRRMKREIGEAELPVKTRQLLYVCITAKERKALEGQVLALRRSMAASQVGEAGTGSASGPASSSFTAASDFSSRAPNAFELKIATARAKIPAVQDYVASVVEQHINDDDKIILFAHHQCMMEAIKEAVEGVRPKQPIDYIYISGETPVAQREQLIHHFRTEPSCSVAILSMQSSGTGHNFTCARIVIFAELDWNPSTHLQCEDRVHRIGQESPCTIKYLLADGTSDSVIWPLLQSKLSITSAVLENSDDIAAARQLNTGADLQKVLRRDTSQAQPSTQGTLDEYLRPSQRSTTPSESKVAGYCAGTVTPLRGTARCAEAVLEQGGDAARLSPLDASCASTPPTDAGRAPARALLTMEELRRARGPPRPALPSSLLSPLPLPLPLSRPTEPTRVSGREPPPAPVAAASVLDLLHGKAAKAAGGAQPTGGEPTGGGRRTTFRLGGAPPARTASGSGSGSGSSGLSDSPLSPAVVPSVASTGAVAAAPNTLVRIPVGFKRRISVGEASLAPAQAVNSPPLKRQASEIESPRRSAAEVRVSAVEPCVVGGTTCAPASRVALPFVPAGDNGATDAASALPEKGLDAKNSQVSPIHTALLLACQKPTARPRTTFVLKSDGATH